MGYAGHMTTKVNKSEIEVGLVLTTTRYSEVVVETLPNSRGMVRVLTWDRSGAEIHPVVPWQVLRWF